MQRLWTAQVTVTDGSQQWISNECLRAHHYHPTCEEALACAGSRVNGLGAFETSVRAVPWVSPS